MALLLDYITNNFITLMILLSLTVTILVNRRIAVPATGYFGAGILTLFLVTVVASIDGWLRQGVVFTGAPEKRQAMLIAMTVLDFLLRPLVLMILSFIVLPDRKLRLPFAVPAIVNGLVYVIAAFCIDASQLTERGSRWRQSVPGMTVYYATIFYLFLLLLFSILYFKRDKLKRSVIVFLIAVQFILVTVLNGLHILGAYVNVISAMGILEYYFYLSVIYQHEMHEAVTQKELTIAQNKLSLLRSQMHPHFIINALSVIRALVKKDTDKAVQGLDAFSDYLNVHIHAIQTDALIPFAQELRHVNAYLSLVQADRSRQIEVRYDLKVTEFLLPPLSLEPLIENAVKYGTGVSNGVITIATEETATDVLIRVSDNGTGDPAQKQKYKSSGVGLVNTRQRLEMQCGGTLQTEKNEDGMRVTVTIPKKTEVPA